MKTIDTVNGVNGSDASQRNVEDLTQPSAPERGPWTAEVEPWPEPVQGAALLDELAAVFNRFVVLPKWSAETLALWTVHTYAFELRDVSTYLGLESPEKRCGKTTLLTVLSELVNRPVVASNISPPAFFRVIEETRPTLLIDEADTLLQGNDELRGILNSGYSRKTAYVVRVSSLAAPKSDAAGPTLAQRTREGSRVRASSAQQFEAQGSVSAPVNLPSSILHPSPASPLAPRPSSLARFSCWCPKVMASIGRLPDTLADRCIVIRMQRKTTHEECERLRNLDPLPLRRQCARFVADHQAAIRQAQPAVPSSLNDRAADIWEPLLALADLAGAEWPERARAAAVGLSNSAQENNPIGSLLWDIFVLFALAHADRMFSRTLIEGLSGFGERPWLELRKGKATTELWLAHQLRRYGVHSRTLRIGEARGRGYLEEDFHEVFRRYIPKSEVDAFRESTNPVPGSTSSQSCGE